MSRSSSDVFIEIKQMAGFAETESWRGDFYAALWRIDRLNLLLEEAKRKLEYEIKCKDEALKLIGRTSK